MFIYVIWFCFKTKVNFQNINNKIKINVINKNLDVSVKQNNVNYYTQVKNNIDLISSAQFGVINAGFSAISELFFKEADDLNSIANHMPSNGLMLNILKIIILV